MFTEAVTPGGSHYVSACPLQVGGQSGVYHQSIGSKLRMRIPSAHSHVLRKVLDETNLPKMCTFHVGVNRNGDGRPAAVFGGVKSDLG